METLKLRYIHVFWAVFLIYVPFFIITTLKHHLQNSAEPVPSQQHATDKRDKIQQSTTETTAPRSGEMLILEPPIKKSTEIPRWLDRPSCKNRGNASRFQAINNKPVTFIAYGRDLKAYYANGFFKHFVPFKVDSKWTAMYQVSKHMQYMEDDKQFHGYKEIWLTSEEAYLTGHGDCEDHAILLADWLSSLGYDARVVFGTYKSDGHAWVVVFEKGTTYLLEATAKYFSKRFPLAAALPDYHPKGMFNSRFIWYNYGSSLTTDYTGKQWVKTARFFTYDELDRYGRTAK